MAGTANNWRIAARALGKGIIWAGLSVPAGSGRITLATDGTPDSTAHPNAFPLGATKEGAKLMAKPTRADQYVDEILAPTDTIVTQMELGISAEFVAVTESKVLELQSRGFGTKTTGSGYEQITFGNIPDVFDCIALIFALRSDATKFGVFNLYKALSDSGIDFGVNQKSQSFMPGNFKGYAVDGRADNDMYGSWWKQV